MKQYLKDGYAYKLALEESLDYLLKWVHKT
jgi:hypothetical protein